MGRAPKPVSLQVAQGNPNRLTKEEIERRQAVEESLHFKADKIKPPTWLGGQAKRTFKFLVKEFEGLNLLVNVDSYVLALFCDAYHSYIECTLIIERDGYVIEGSRSAEAGVVAHPLLAKKTQLAAQMNKQMSLLGLSPVDRVRLTNLLPQPEENDEEDETKKFKGRL
jgi:P27 family predicted phage terminase small subunit